MNMIASLKGQFELIWIAITLVIIGAVMWPIYQQVPDYPFYISNILFITIFVTFTRWIFLLKYTWLGRQLWVKVIFFFLCIPVFIMVMDLLSEFQFYLDEYGIQTFLDHLSQKDLLKMSKYIRSEMIFFGTGSMVATVILAFRLLMSVWLVHNRDRV